jgi:hypothetical protein
MRDAPRVADDGCVRAGHARGGRQAQSAGMMMAMAICISVWWPLLARRERGVCVGC